MGKAVLAVQSGAHWTCAEHGAIVGIQGAESFPREGTDAKVFVVQASAPHSRSYDILRLNGALNTSKMSEQNKADSKMPPICRC